MPVLDPRVCEYCGEEYISAAVHALECSPAAYGDHDDDIF